MLPHIVKHNRTSKATELVLACVDPAPGKGDAFAAEATARGVQARAVEATVEQVLDAEQVPNAVVVYVAVDRATAAKAAVAGARARGLPAIGYFVLSFPQPVRRLFGIRFVIGADEVRAQRELDLLLDALTAIVPRGSSRDVFGSGSAADHHSEPAIRAGFAEHLTRNAPKVTAKLDPESPPLEIASSEQVSTLHVLDHASAWASAATIWQDVLNNPDVSLRRGSSMVVAEIGPGPGIRLHQATVRALDGKLVFGSPLGDVTRRGLADLQERDDRAAARQQADAAATVSRLSPVDMTD